MNTPAGWGGVDDAESIRALNRALDLGVTFFDTAANYGTGHSERLLGSVLKGRRSNVVISTKFGYLLDEKARKVVSYNENEADSDLAAHVRENLESSMKRLGTDYVDVYLIHVWGLSVERALAVREVLEALVGEGKIRTYGWSTDRTDAIDAFSDAPHASIIQQQLSVLDGNMELLALCEKKNLASMNRGPLGMGLLTGKFTPETSFGKTDVRSCMQWHPGFKDGRPTTDWLNKLASIREVLTSGGRTLSQGALCWLWGRSGQTIPIPGFKSVKQVEENAKALAFGPLPPAQMAEIDRILGR
jgi:aryl-alcohol dehydrogenase-like predicted oxidoreductase